MVLCDWVSAETACWGSAAMTRACEVKREAGRGRPTFPHSVRSGDEVLFSLLR